MPTLREKLDEAEARLRANGVADPRREATLLLSVVLEREKAFLIAHPEYELSGVEVERIDETITRRASREPFQYIAGTTEFYGLDFKVTPEVLIPRPETEMVVEAAIALLDGEASFCEVGIGSGCIAIAILFHASRANAVGLDVSPEALDIAGFNAARHKVNDRLTFRESDVFSALHDERFDLIVSNPPYVPARDFAGLQAEVRDFEPRVALTDGSDGLSIIRRIIDGAPRFLMPEGFLLMEIGFDQSEKVKELFDRVLWNEPELFPDLQGIPRLVRARLKETEHRLPSL